VPNELLLEVHSSCSGKYIKVVNDHIEGGVLLLDEISTRLRKCMETEAGRLHSRVTKAGGSRKRETLLQGNTCFVVGKGEAVNVRDYSTEMEFYKVCCILMDMQLVHGYITLLPLWSYWQML